MHPTLPANLLLAMVLLAPTALAATVQGDLWSPDGFFLSGPSVATAPRGLLDLSGAASGLRIAWTSAEGLETWVAGPRLVASDTWMGDDGSTQVNWEPGSLSNVTCRGDCVIVLHVGEADEGRLGVEGHAAGLLAKETRAARVGKSVSLPQSSLTVSFVAETGWLVASTGVDGPGLHLDRGRPLAAGTVRLLLYNASADLLNGTEPGRVVTGETREPGLGLPGAPVSEHVRVSFLSVRLSGARLELPEGSPATLAAPALSLETEGVVSSPRAQGQLHVEGRRRDVHDEPVRLEGFLSLAAGLDPRPPAPRAGDLAGEPHAGLSGEATGVRVGDEELVAPSLSPAPLATTLLATGALGGLFLALRAGLATWLYTRIARSRVLQNENRTRIFTAIAANPGIHVNELARRMDMGRVVVQHHLRMLESHGLVQARPIGRVRAYYVTGETPDPSRCELDVALKDATRRLVLDTIRTHPGGASQRDVCERTGLSQRLVSYHVARLEAVGAIHGDNGRPRRFRPPEQTGSPQGPPGTRQAT